MCSKMLLWPRRTPLAGYNHNVLYKQRVFHAQTEDSGLEPPDLRDLRATRPYEPLPRGPRTAEPK